MAGKPGKYGIDPETGYPLCKQGHVLSPENANKVGQCKTCRKSFYQSEKRKKYLDKYFQSEKHKENKKAYRQSERGMECQKAYEQSGLNNLSNWLGFKDRGGSLQGKPAI